MEIINIGKSQSKYAKDVLKRLEEINIRGEIAKEDMTLGKRIREAEMQKIPYILIIGDKEVKAKSISVRQRGKGDLGAMKLSKFIKKVKLEA